jgi:hypothetical protein
MTVTGRVLLVLALVALIVAAVFCVAVGWSTTLSG